MRPKLKLMLAGAFTLVAIVPVIFLGLWVERTALEREIAAVHEKHLLLAQNLTAALERYVTDTRTAFEYFIELAEKDEPLEGISVFSQRLGFVNFRVVDKAGRVLKSIHSDVQGTAIPRRVVALIAKNAKNSVEFSGVMADEAGHPTIYLYRRMGPDRFAVGELSTKYIVSLQRTIRFGRKGHAAIVDQNGAVIGHPFPQWEKQMKSLAKVKPVKRMMEGRTGVVQFYSPAVKKDMISGYTTVPGVGWGVMVPQPMEELEERASEVKLVALVIVLVGLATAALIAWLMAGVLVRPVQAVLGAARKITDGELDARVSQQSNLTPDEFVELSKGFNAMAGRIQQGQENMAEALRDARLADRAKSEFLANMSHELRTPLNAIIGFSETIHMELYGPLGSPRYKEYVHDIGESGQHLLAIINDILDLSRIEAGNVEIKNDVVDIDQVVGDALVLVAGRAKQADIDISLHIMDNLPHLRGSEVKLKQVLVNLFSNAIKFTPAGGAMTISAWCDEGGGISIRVNDTGIGMSEEEIEIALVPFQQVDGKLDRKFEGSGLGLPLAKRLTELHDGELVINSVPGQGTEITVRLPATRSLQQVA